MPRISPWDDRFRRAKAEPETRTVLLPELETSVTFREGRDDLWKGQIADLEDLYTYQHAGKKPRKPLALPGGAGVLPGSRELFRQVAGAEILQVANDGEEPFSMLDFIGIARHLDHRWTEIKAALGYLTDPRQEETDSGNGSAAPETELSAPGSTTSTPILSSSTTPPTASA